MDLVIQTITIFVKAVRRNKYEKPLKQSYLLGTVSPRRYFIEITVNYEKLYLN